MNKGTAIIGFFLCFLAGMGLMYSVDRSRGVSIASEGAKGAPGSAIPSHANLVIPVTNDDPSWGNPDALVTIVEFSDFECPFCGRVVPTLEQIKQTYTKDQVRIVWKNQPLSFHKAARPAAEAAQTVFALGGNDAFWKFHDKAFANMKALNDANFEAWAGEVGVDVAKFKADYTAKKHAAKVEGDIKVAMAVGANGTPAFRINGVELSGAQPFEKFKEVIDAQLKEAEALLATKVARSEIYPQLLQKNQKAAPAPEKAPTPQPEAEDTTVWRVPVEAHNPVKGPKDALVTIIEFSDYQCPFCQRVEATMKQITDTYPNDVRIVWKDNALPFHPRAKPAAALARVAREKKGDAGYWTAHAALFESHPKFEDQDLEAVSSKVGIPWAEVKKAIDTGKYDKVIQADMDLAADTAARGTPHFFINGRRLSGAQPFDKFKSLIDEELTKAKAMVASGTPKAKVYDELMKNAKGPPPPERKEVGPAPATAPYKGKKDAKVVIHEFSDFECPFCGRVNPTLKQVIDEYGDRVKIVWRNLPLPFHKNADLAAQAAHEAQAQKGNDGFWQYHDKLFENQQKGLTRDTLEAIAQEMQLDMTKFKAALDQGTHKKKVDDDKAEAEKAGVRGTPGFVVNGYFISGAQPFSAFKKTIDLALKEVK
ncbi:MAG: thioredoxin domain-containing protein [Polyangiaceae bacterium]|nr:thioredoxin domain-containing protein [Polyangiaceae bacterium]MCW5792545.1 thioredoxin domain-containing protein [Polyangiaceae bacterium]